MVSTRASYRLAQLDVWHDCSVLAQYSMCVIHAGVGSADVGCAVGSAPPPMFEHEAVQYECKDVWVTDGQ